LLKPEQVVYSRVSDDIWGSSVQIMGTAEGKTISSIVKSHYLKILIAEFG
jgi:hypothetical protein